MVWLLGLYFLGSRIFCFRDTPCLWKPSLSGTDNFSQAEGDIEKVAFQRSDSVMLLVEVLSLLRGLAWRVSRWFVWLLGFFPPNPAACTMRLLGDPLLKLDSKMTFLKKQIGSIAFKARLHHEMNSSYRMEVKHCVWQHGNTDLACW